MCLQKYVIFTPYASLDSLLGCLPSVYAVGNVDLQTAVPRVEHYLERMHQARQELFHTWNITKAKLEQVLSWRMFEEDCDGVSLGG